MKLVNDDNMNEKIKEILDRLDYNEWEVDLYKVPITWCELYDIRDYITNLQNELKFQKEQEKDYFEKHTKLLKDYTNLQKENEELKSKNDILEFRMKQNDKMVICERYRILKQRDDYKQKIDKAIEYITNEKHKQTAVGKYTKDIHKNLLKILGDDE